jgi:hypothetical protein
MAAAQPALQSPTKPLTARASPRDRVYGAHPRRRRLGGHKQIHDFDFKGVCQVVKGRERRVGQARLDAAQVGAKHTAALREFFLRDGLGCAQLLDA